MSDSINFYQVKNLNIFQSDFADLRKDNKVVFGYDKGGNIAVFYAPNGTGKTSLADVLGTVGSNSDRNFSVKYKKKTYTTENNELFHVIKDQKNRNIIEGKESDYLIGDNINREFNLRDSINSDLTNLVNEVMYKGIKEYGFTAQKNPQFLDFQNTMLTDITKVIIPASRKNFDIHQMMAFVISLEKADVPIYDDERMKFLYDNYSDNKSVIAELLSLEGKQINTDERAIVIGRNKDAIELVNKYKEAKICIVCDNPEYNPGQIVQKKNNENDDIFKQLDKTSKLIVEKILSAIDKRRDPFGIVFSIEQLIKKTDESYLDKVIEEIKNYIQINELRLNNYFFDVFEEKKLTERINEYNSLTHEAPQIDEEDLLFVKEFVENSIGRQITLIRNNNNIQLMLDQERILNTPGEKFHLSTGEQNFISLTFELIKAKKTSKEIIVLDDPISSFDSIFKNKIAFTLLKFLNNKNVIVLTHNTDLIRLLEYQLRNSFRLYIFNNFTGARNGFVEVSNVEKDILLNLNKLLDLFRTRKNITISDERRFLISMIPFMRGYANLISDSDSYKKLSKVMHGYENRCVNITKIYSRLFCKRQNGQYKIATDYLICVRDILEVDLINRNIVDQLKYPLLNKTLFHTMCYLNLRLLVENVLVRKYSIKHRGTNPLLAQIITEAFVESRFGSDDEKRKAREIKAKLSSKKTLLNEFNHFEGNLSIFQPAIDISDDILQGEIREIKTLLEEVKSNL